MRSSRSAPDPLGPNSLGFAHRGLHGRGVPENSLAAFRAAAKLTCGAECDVRLSRDGVPMVFHDADLLRLCGSGERISECDSGWLGGQALLGTAETIPSLSELLRAWPSHASLLIECKTQGNAGRTLAGAVAAVLDDQPRRAGIMSFDPSVSRWLSENRPDRPRGLVVDSQWPADACAAILAEARPTFLAIDIRMIEDPLIASLRRHMPIYCWTVRTAAQRKQALVHADALIWESNGRP